MVVVVRLPVEVRFLGLDSRPAAERSASVKDVAARAVDVDVETYQVAVFEGSRRGPAAPGIHVLGRANVDLQQALGAEGEDVGRDQADQLLLGPARYCLLL